VSGDERQELEGDEDLAQGLPLWPSGMWVGRVLFSPSEMSLKNKVASLYDFHNKCWGFS
jgi:hypothetical protein